jgi:protein-tyrosine phosphatase
MIASMNAAVQPFPCLTNFREVSGLQRGIVFRSDRLSRMTPADFAGLQKLNVKLICDLRSPRETRQKPTRLPAGGPIRLANISLHDPELYDIGSFDILRYLFSKRGGDRFEDFSRSYYRHIAFERPAQLRGIMSVLAEDGNLPTLIHCNAGKDRTGLIAALLQLLVGVPFESVLADYMLTNEFYKPRLDRFIRRARVLTLRRLSEQRIRALAMAHPEDLQFVYDSIVSNYGCTERYLTEGCGLNPQTLDRLKERLKAAPFT